jgi:hypothetical protein
VIFSRSILPKLWRRVVVLGLAESIRVLAMPAPLTFQSSEFIISEADLFLFQTEAQHKSEVTERPYSALMRQQNVARAFFEINSVWRHGKPADVQIVRRLYFRSFEGANSQIVDQQHLGEIQQSGLQNLLDQTALNRMNSAQLFGGVHGVRHPEGKRLYTYLNFFADSSREEPRVLASPYKKLDPFSQAVYLGDNIELSRLLDSQKFSRQQLNGALFLAVRNYFDNTDVISRLIQAGGELNARTDDGRTLLMTAIGVPAQVKALIKIGADVNARDRFGNTALKQAEKSHDAQSAQLLREAGATQ